MLDLTFALFLRTAWCAAILLLLVWTIQKLAGRWLSPRARYALWLLVAFRLVILWTPASSLSLVGQLENRITSAMSTEPSPKVEAESLENTADDPTDIDVDFHFDAFPREVALAPLNIKPEVPAWQWSDIPAWSIVAGLWIFGVAFFGALLGRDFWRLRRAICSMSPVSDPKLLELVRRIERELRMVHDIEQSRGPSPLHPRKTTQLMGERARVRGLFQRYLAWQKPVRVLISQDLASPAVTGVFAPALLLPALFVERLTEKELEHVIRHELTHVKRRDVLVNWLLAGIGAVYWFFPLMRYLLSQLRKTRELACDAMVLRSASANERRAYGKTLLKVMEMVSEADRPALTFTVGVAGMVWNIGNARKESQMMRERLEIVVRDRTQRGRAGWLVGAMALVLIAVGFTEAQEKKPAVEVEEITKLTGVGAEDAQPVERVGFEFERRVDAPLVQSYDLTNLAKQFEDTAIRGTKSADEALRDWVGKVVRDSRWSNPKEVQIAWEGKTATIKHSAAGHTRFLKAIKAFHKQPEHQFVLELSLASLSAEDFKKLDLDRLTNVRNEASRLSDPISGATVRPQNAGETTLQRVVSQSFLLSNTELERASIELAGLASYQRLQAPKVTTLNGEIANITVGNTRPFVTSIERIKGVDQPYVEVLFDGMQLESQAIALGDDQVWLRLQLQKSEVDAEKIATHKEGTVELQSPKVRSLSQITGVEMNDGQTLLMFIQTKGDDGKETVQVIVAKVQSISIADAPRAIEPPKQGERLPDEKNLPAAKTQLQLPPMRTEVLDVSQTPAFRTFAKLTDQDDEMRAKLLGPAYQQLEVLITETIDPESPKVLKRNMENLTLEVTASQEVLEKVCDLVKQLVRLAEKEAAATQTFVTKTYNIADALIFRVKPVAGQGASIMDGRLVKAEVKTFVALVKEVNPEFDNPGSGRKIEPDFDNLSITVTGSPQDHSRIKEHVHWMSRMILDMEKKRHRALMGSHSGKFSSSGDEGSALNANRIGVEFTPSRAAMMRRHDKAIYSAIEKIVDINFKNKPLSEVLKVLGETTQINIVIDAAGFVEEGLKSNHPVSLQVKEPVSLKSALKLILDPLNLDYAVKDESLIITSKRLIEGQTIAVAYDVADLVIPIPPPEFAKLSDDQKKKFMTEDCFKDVLQRIFEENPDFVERLNKGFEINPFPTNLTLVISGTPDDHERIAKRLELLRRLKKRETTPPAKSANRTKADEWNETRALEMKIRGIKPSDMKGRTVAYDLSEFFLRCSNKSQGGMQPDNFDCGNPFTHVFAYLGQKLPELVPGEDTNEMQPFWTDRMLIVSTTPELQEKVAEFLKQLNKMSAEEAKQLIESNNVLADPSGQLLGRVDKSGNVLSAYRIDNELIRKVSVLNEKGQEPKQEVAMALQTLKSLTEGAIPAFVEKKPRAWIHDFASNQTLSVNAPEEDQEKVADLLKQLNRVPEEQLAKAVKDSKSR